MKNLIAIATVVTTIFVWFGFKGENIKPANYFEDISNLPPTNLTGADLTGATLVGVSLEGVILCNTTMPNGKLNNSSCKN